MDNPEVIIGLLIGAFLGGVIGWLLGSRKSARAEAEREATQTRIEEQRKASEEQLAMIRKVNDQAISQLKDSFKALSVDALKEAQPALVERLEKFQAVTKGDLNTSKEAVAKLVAPLKEQLETYQKRLAQSSNNQTEQLSKVTQHLETLGEQSHLLSKETEQLRQILNSSQQRGRWGEETLRRVVEAAGLSAHCDFTEQAQAAEGRPDLVVHLPGNRHIVIDSKVPDFSFLNELDAADPAERKAAFEQHAKKMRDTIKALADRNYPKHIEGALDCVVMFVPAESLFSAALEGDPGLIIWAAERRITLATPTSLIALLSSVKVSWQYHTQSENARNIAEASQELYSRLVVFISHFEKIRKGLEQAGKAYNAALGSYERSVRPSGERVNKLQVGETEGSELPNFEPVNEVLREIPVALPESSDRG